MKNNALKCLKFLLHWRTVCFFLFSLAAIIFIGYNQSYSFVSSAGKHKLKTTKKYYVSTLCNCQREVVVDDEEEEPYYNFISNVLHDGPSRSESSSDFHWCGPESSMRGKGQKVISFVLYGHQQVNERYSSLIRNISSTAENLYPGWVVRIIYKIFDIRAAAGVDENLCDAYCQFNNIDLCSMSDLIDRLRFTSSNRTSNNLIDPDVLVGLHPKMWRFLAILDPNVDVFLSRDLDSLIWQREVDAVGQWIRSNFTFHSMRDHPQHDVTFLGGNNTISYTLLNLSRYTKPSTFFI